MNGLDTDAVAELSAISQLRDINPNDSRLILLKNSTVRNEQVFHLKFMSTKRSTDTKVYRLVPFTIYTNLTKDPYLIKYEGPTLAIYNSTANCTKGLTKSQYGSGVMARCSEQNYRDRELDN